jgi:hypothetical protein
MERQTTKMRNIKNLCSNDNNPHYRPLKYLKIKRSYFMIEAPKGLDYAPSFTQIAMEHSPAGSSYESHQDNALKWNIPTINTVGS